MEIKTNVMRVLDSLKIPYRSHQYSPELTIGTEVADALRQPYRQVFKTLVTVGKSKKNYVFMIPVDKELNLKKAAHAAQEKSIDMLPAKELLPLTGYIHGGCSPIGMKKQFPTFIDATAQQQAFILCSAGKVGFQVELTLDALQRAVPIGLVDLVGEA